VGYGGCLWLVWLCQQESKTPQAPHACLCLTLMVLAGQLNGESAFQRGVHAMAVTIQNARAGAGSDSSYGAARDAVISHDSVRLRVLGSEVTGALALTSP